jgi:quercetin dioxygenase-like cupin family protein
MYKYLYLAVLMHVLASPAPVHASDAGQAPTWTFQDPGLEWGPCPEFLPKGCAIAVLHGDPAKENADVFFKVPAGAIIPRHWHASAERMVLVSGEMEIEYDGHSATTLKPGMYAYGPARLPHKASCKEGDPCVLFIAFESPIDAIPSDAKVE